MKIEFIQYLPNGRRKRVLIQRPRDIVDRAADIKRAGYRLECKALGNGSVAVGIADLDADELLASRVVPNDEGVPLAVDAMINEFHQKLVDVRALIAIQAPALQ
jgi:hypothetical protein